MSVILRPEVRQMAARSLSALVDEKLSLVAMLEASIPNGLPRQKRMHLEQRLAVAKRELVRAEAARLEFLRDNLSSSA